MTDNFKKKHILLVLLIAFFLSLTGCEKKDAEKAPDKMQTSQTTATTEGFVPLAGDFSNFDPNNLNFPTSGDTIKIGVFEAYSGGMAGSGTLAQAWLGWVVHDVNSQGGIFVDGKMKKIQLFKGDTQSKPAAAKRAAEKLVLEDKVDFMIGTTGTHLAAIGMQVAKKYKKLYVNHNALSESLMEAKGFNRYTFRVAGTTYMMARALAYGFAARSERKFFILCQDYAYGHSFGKAFTEALKKYRPEAEIVGELYHPIFAKDFAPYMTKVKGSGAEVIITGNYWFDADNVMKQVKQLGLKMRIAGPFIANPDTLRSMGKDPMIGTNQILEQELPLSWNNPAHVKFLTAWRARSKVWEKPYNTPLYKWPTFGHRSFMATYWVLDLMKRLKTTDTEKIIEAWEGDEFVFNGYTVKMDACNHETAMDYGFTQLGFPNGWQDDVAAPEEPFVVPARFCMPYKDPKLCDKNNNRIAQTSETN